MFNRRKIFIVITFDNIPGLFDYPKELPIPKIGEAIRFNEKYGKVKDVRYATSDNVTEIKIVCSDLEKETTL